MSGAQGATLTTWRAVGPEGPVQIEEVRESATARVYLGAARAYKLRRAVDLGIRNTATRRQRWAASVREMALGMRAAPHVYEGLWSFDEGAGELSLERTDGEPVLVMRRLPNDQRVDRVMASGGAVDRLDGMLEALADFHIRATPDADPEGPGSPASVLYGLTGVLAELPTEVDESQPPPPFDAEDKALLDAQGRAGFLAIEPLLRQRLRAGRVREGHGKLRPEHVFLTAPDAITGRAWSVISPLDESEALRVSDLAAEIATLAVGLDQLGRRDAADYAVSRYAALTYDPSLAEVIGWFKARSALQRASELWHLARLCEADARTRLAADARQHAQLALTLLS